MRLSSAFVKDHTNGHEARHLSIRSPWSRASNSKVQLTPITRVFTTPFTPQIRRDR